MTRMSHSQLVERAAKWLKGTWRCRVVITERLALSKVNERPAGYGCSVCEMPDAIGWADHKSILVECKTSIGDMVADKRKSFRMGGGAGDVRYILCEKGVIPPSYCLPGWGMAYICGKVVRVVLRPKPIEACAIGLRRERYLLLAEVCRMGATRTHDDLPGGG